MRRRAVLRSLLTSAALAVGAVAATSPSGPPADSGGRTRTLHGIYTSGFQNGPQRLRAEFTPAEEGAWKVSFHFRWSGADRVYTGGATGSLTEGVLRGRVVNEDRTRVFSFRCEFDKKGRCKGRHAEVVPTGEHDTGTLTLRAPR